MWPGGRGNEGEEGMKKENSQMPVIDFVKLTAAQLVSVDEKLICILQLKVLCALINVLGIKMKSLSKSNISLLFFTE